MGLRDKLRRLENSARGELDWIELEDGSRCYYGPVSARVFLHSLECLRAQSAGATTFPEPPVVRATARAKDRRAVFDRVYSGGFGLLPYDRDALIARGEFVPVSMVAGYELGEWCDEDLSE